MLKTFLMALAALVAVKLVAEAFLWILSSIQSKEPVKFTDSYMKMVSEWIAEHRGHFDTEEELASSVETIFRVKNRIWINAQ